MSDVKRGASGRCQDCGGSSSYGKGLLNAEIGSLTMTLCDKCAEELRDKLIETVGAPTD